jgi:hypothetical protein
LTIFVEHKKKAAVKRTQQKELLISFLEDEGLDVSFFSPFTFLFKQKPLKKKKIKVVTQFGWKPFVLNLRISIS